MWVITLFDSKKWSNRQTENKTYTEKEHIENENHSLETVSRMSSSSEKAPKWYYPGVKMRRRLPVTREINGKRYSLNNRFDLDEKADAYFEAKEARREGKNAWVVLLVNYKGEQK